MSDTRDLNTRPWASKLALVACAALLSVACLSTPAPVEAAPKAGFSKFCSSWMAKLQKRQAQNAKQVKIRKQGAWYTGVYTGYSRKPLKCKTSATGNPTNPYVGRIVYEEIQYQHAGQTRSEAKQSKANPRTRTEVIEIFRYDGSAWVY